ncbi:S-norcoclaurine synthase 1-like [Miscanthus floridulus]|uniref:S-norcoclaurine synthase 1-like n=1 Tax=Miscanthus floridulus TaxID=154761 RepID=UPI0034580E5A
MESKQSTEGKTIPVKNDDVQALAENAAAELTAEAIQRYIRPDLESPNDMVVVAHHDHGESIPVIDLARLLDSQTSQKEAAVLKYACEDWGFFQVENHGIPDTVLEKMRNNMECFFRLPLDERKKFRQLLPGDVLVDSENRTLEWSDNFGLITQPPRDRDLTAWPTTPVNCRESIESYSSEVMRITHSLVQMIAKNLGVDDPDKIRDTYCSQALGIACYPACPVAHDKVLGVSPHSDVSLLTVVWELNHVQGLQIKRHGAWVPIKPHPKALVVNVGDILEILTNGKYQSIEHRVTVNPHKERLSITAFHMPKVDMSVGPLPEIAGGAELKKYKTLRVDEIIAFSSKHEGKKAKYGLFSI